MAIQSNNLTKNSFLSISINIFIYFFDFVLIFLLAKFLGPFEFGNYILLFSLIKFIGLPIMVGYPYFILKASEIKYLLSQFKIFIGARMHSTIASLSSNIPTIIISYSIKSKGINEMIFENQRLVLNCNEINHFNLINKIDYILKNEEYLRKNMVNKNKSIRKLLNVSSLDLYKQIP